MFKKEIIFGEIIVSIIILSLLVYFIRKWWIANHEEAGAGDIAKGLEKKSTNPEQIKRNHSFPYDRVAKMIWDSKSVFGDDENKVYAAFKLVENLAQMNYLVLYFKKYMKQDMYEFLNSFLDESELSKINDIVKKLK